LPHDFQADIDAIARIAAVPAILDVVCRTTGMGFAAVARVTEDRWIVCRALDSINFGLETGGELKVATTICNEIRQHGAAVVIDHVAEDGEYCGHPTAVMYGFQSYISMPIIRADGRFFGTLCAIDPRPARLKNPETIGMFKLFAELIATHLDADERLLLAESSLLSERKAAELREQFVAVLGHDLRNPVAAIGAGLQLLLKRPLDDNSKMIIGHMQSSVVRMAGLIDNVMDFARGRLSGGLHLDVAERDVEPVLAEVIEELRAVNPSRVIETAFAIDRPIACDRLRVAQLLSNLVGNALSHGAKDQPVRVGATTKGERFVLWVANAGTPIPEGARDQLFEPFFRGDAGSNKGLGLGLYIARQIALAHQGTLDLASNPAETRFTFTMPLDG
jgi:signal transduction histidine kinase